MVEVQVREDDVELGRAASLHLDTERPHAGAGVEHERVAVAELDLDARRVAAVAHRVRPGRRERAPATPHASPSCLSALPRRRPRLRACSSARPNSGKAVASISCRMSSTVVNASVPWAGALLPVRDADRHLVERYRSAVEGLDDEEPDPLGGSQLTESA